MYHKKLVSTLMEHLEAFLYFPYEIHFFFKSLRTQNINALSLIFSFTLSIPSSPRRLQLELIIWVTWRAVWETNFLSSGAWISSHWRFCNCEASSQAISLIVFQIDNFSLREWSIQSVIPWNTFGSHPFRSASISLSSSRKSISLEKSESCCQRGIYYIYIYFITLYKKIIARQIKNLTIHKSIRYAKNIFDISFDNTYNLTMIYTNIWEILLWLIYIVT